MADAPKLLGTDTLRTAYPKVNQAIDNANEALRNSEEALNTANQALANSINTQAQLDQIVIEGDSSVEAAQARVAADGTTYPTLKKRLDTEHQEISFKLETNMINVMYPPSHLVAAKGDGVTDDTDALQNIINYARENRIGIVFLPGKTYLITRELFLKDGIKLVGTSYGNDYTTLKFTGVGYCIRTGENHLRQCIDGINIDLGDNASGGIRIGDDYANLDRDNGILPRQIELTHINIRNLKPGQVGILFQNASGVRMKQVRLGYGSGGTGCIITCDGINSGVFVAEECAFGRVNDIDVGLEIRHGLGGLDGYTFNSCYFGGKSPVKMTGASSIKNIVFNAPHLEMDLQQTETAFFDIENVQGMTVNAGELVAYGSSTCVGFLFRGFAAGLNINSIDCNEWDGGIVYKNLNTSSPTNSILSYAIGSGTKRNFVQTVGDFSKCLLVGNDEIKTNKITTTQINTNNIFAERYYFTTTNRKITFGANSPVEDQTFTPASRGDFRFNSTPYETGETGKKYIVLGWSCVGSGTPGNWVECRVLTGN